MQQPLPPLDHDWASAVGKWPIRLAEDPTLRKSFDLLRRKWTEVPFEQYNRCLSTDLLSLPDQDILRTWESAYRGGSTGEAFSVRGWYQTIYKDVFLGKKVLDVGCGLAPDTVFYAQHGAQVTFLDIAESNVRFAERVCRLKGIQDASFCHMEDLGSVERLPHDFDVIYCAGSMITVPIEIARMEAQAYLAHLVEGGRWVELGYPRTRWEREGRLGPVQWGDRTDGGAPWTDWHDLAKLRYMLWPRTFDTVLAIDFHGSDFNWFDLIVR
jgi:SAM-dependent methyltransferase